MLWELLSSNGQKGEKCWKHFVCLCPDEAVGAGAAGSAGSVLSQSAGHREEELTAQKR